MFSLQQTQCFCLPPARKKQEDNEHAHKNPYPKRRIPLYLSLFPPSRLFIRCPISSTETSSRHAPHTPSVPPTPPPPTPSRPPPCTAASRRGRARRQPMTTPSAHTPESTPTPITASRRQGRTHSVSTGTAKTGRRPRTSGHQFCSGYSSVSLPPSPFRCRCRGLGAPSGVWWNRQQPGVGAVMLVVKPVCDVCLSE